MSLVVFSLIYFYLSNQFQIHSFIAQIGQIKIINKTKNEYLSKILKQKRGLDVKSFIIFESDKPFAMMPTMFGKPEVIVSSKMYKTFTKGEMEWVLMHEATHYIDRHNLKAALLEIFFLLFGTLVINYFSLNTFFSALLAGILSVIFVQINRRVTERDADDVAVKFCNPRDMISGANKLRDYYFTGRSTSFFYKYLFSWNIMPEERIAIAEKAL